MSTARSLQVVLLIGLSLVVGCSKATPLGLRVTGRVMANESLLDEGLITFIPIGATTGQKCSVVIHDGKYSFEPSDGLMAGEYRVEIMGLPPGVKAMAEGKAPSHSNGQYREIASEFNEKSRLRITLQTTSDNLADFSVKYVQ